MKAISDDPVRIILAIFQAILGALYLVAAIAGAFSRTTPEYHFLAGFGCLAVTWGLLSRKPWVLVAQVAVLFALVLVGMEMYDPTPVAPGWHLYDSLEVFMAVGPALFLGIVTSAFVVVHRNKISKPHPVSIQSRMIEWGLLLALVVAVLLGDFVLPDQCAKIARQREDVQLQEQKRRERAQAIALVKFRQTLEELDRAIREDDSETTSVLVADALAVRDKTDYGSWIRALKSGSKNALLRLLKEADAGRLPASDFVWILTDPDVDRAVRCRATITIMNTAGKGTRRHMGSLKYLSHPRVVELLAEALNASDFSTVEERVALARALQETAELPDFNAGPAIPVLQAIAESDDHDSVRDAAIAALTQARNPETNRGR